MVVTQKAAGARKRLTKLRYRVKRVLVPQKVLLRRAFKRAHGYYPDIDQPRSLSEKLQWIKLNHELDAFAPFVDKHEVRRFVASRVDERHLVPLIGVYDSVDEIDFGALPERFVMKATHGCGWNIRVKDKRVADWDAMRAQMRGWLGRDYSRASGETCYRSLKGRVLIEEDIEPSAGSPMDFKFYCCDGEPLGLHVDVDRFGSHAYRVFDASWREMVKTGPSANQPPVIPKPDNLDELLSICRALSKGFSYVRVDLYNPAHRALFGELTFVPASGMIPFDPVWSDYYFGEPLDIRRYVPRLQAP